MAWQRRGWWYLGLATVSCAYVAANMWFASGLWFWWDELTIVNSQSEPLGGLLQGHIGNFLPLGRLAFLVETLVFGGWYPGYVGVNAVMVLLIVALTYRLVRVLAPPGAWRSAVLLLVVATYAMAAGVIYNVQWGYQIAWFLSIGAALGGAYAVTGRGKPVRWAWAALAVSWLALGSNIIPAVLLMAALILLQPAFRTRAIAGHLAAMVALSGPLMFASHGLAKVFSPSDPTAVGRPVHLPSSLEHIVGVAQWAQASAVSWVLTPVGFVLPTNPVTFRAFGTQIHEHSLVVTGIAAALVIAAAIAAAQARRVPIALVLVPTLALSTLVAIRGYDWLRSDLAIRYAPMSLAAPVVFWSVLALRRTDRRAGHVAAAVLAAALVITSLVTLGSSFRTLASASDPGRLARSQQQMTLARQCWQRGTTEVLPEIQPVMDGRQFCAIVKRFGVQR